MYRKGVLRFDEALSRLLALAAPALPAVETPLANAAGRVLAHDVAVKSPLPAFDYSTMDGYALATAQLPEALPFSLAVHGESRTGQVAGMLCPSTTMRIFTGAPLPDGADAVVMQEEVTREGSVATFVRKPRPGQFVRRRGDDLAAGATALARGTRLGPAHLALAASLDLAALPVAAAPAVALIATGDELRAPGSPHVPGTIPEANTAAIAAMARGAGADVDVRPYVRDDRAATEHALSVALDAADVVVSIGGVSVGDHDVVRPALETLGVSLEFWRVAIKPGKPLAIGRFARDGRREAIVLGLPGNPASAIVTFAVFGIPFLRALQGDPRPFPPLVRARMTRAHAHDAGRLELARARLSESSTGLAVTTFENQASGALTSMAAADALAFLPADAKDVAAGDEVDVLRLADVCA